MTSTAVKWWMDFHNYTQRYIRKNDLTIFELIELLKAELDYRNNEIKHTDLKQFKI